jgi:hypothetical protein
MMRELALVCLFLGCTTPTLAHAEEPVTYRISRDPFVVPKFVIAATAPAVPVVKEKPVAELLFRSMNLRAAVSAGRNSLVNVDGKIIAMGEKLEGYKLIKVGNGDAVFESNGMRQTLKMERESKQ